MARKTEVKIVCDGCSNEIAEDTKGVSRISVDTVGVSDLRKLDFCPDCTGKLPEGTTRKRPGPRSKK